MTGLEAEQEKAREVARREAVTALGLTGRSVKDVGNTEAPFVFDVLLDDDTSRLAFVVDGHIVTQPGLKALGGYLRAIGFLERRNLKFEELTAITEAIGEVPPSVPTLATQSIGPEGEQASLVFSDAEARATYFYELPSTGAIGNPIVRVLRATLHVPRGYELKWTVEVRPKAPGAQWALFHG